MRDHDAGPARHADANVDTGGTQPDRRRTDADLDTCGAHSDLDTCGTHSDHCVDANLDASAHCDGSSPHANSHADSRRGRLVAPGPCSEDSCVYHYRQRRVHYGLERT